MHKPLGAFLKYWLQLFLVPVYWASHLMIRKKNLWVIGSTFGRRWADNGRYLYLYLNQQQSEQVQAVWISRKKEIVSFLRQNGYPAYYVRSLKGIWYCLRAKVYLYDNYTKDICFWTSGGAIHMNMWHGSGNKKINHDNKHDYLRHPRTRREWWSNYLISMTNEKPSDYILATSPMMKTIFAGAFGVPENHVLVNGYPRNDMLIGHTIENVYTDEERRVIRCMDEQHAVGDRVVIYMPTFRASETKFFEVMDLENFNHFLQEEHIFFYTKLHPKSKVRSLFEGIQVSNIVNIEADADPYAFLGRADALVTDYSSIYSDYTLLDRPTVFFLYDFEEYSHDTRENYFPYEEWMPETKAYTMQELMSGIRDALGGNTDAEGRHALRTKLFELEDGDSAQRLYRKIQELVNGSKKHKRGKA